MSPLRIISVLAAIGALLCSPASAKVRTAGFDPPALDSISTTLLDSIHREDIPGAVFLMEKDGRRWGNAYGYRQKDPTVEPVKPDTIYDVASLTKVVVTAPAILILMQEGKLTLEDKVVKFLPAFTGGGKETVTLRQLLTHMSGTGPGLPRELVWDGYDAGVAEAVKLPLKNAPGTVFTYSDLNFIMLGEVAHLVSGLPLDEFATRRIFRPLGMVDSRFRPARESIGRIAPTTREPTGLVQGVVHDPTSRRMGGVAGHAGLFTTAPDMARYCRMLLAEGKTPDGSTLLTPESVRLMFTPQPGVTGTERGIGLDVQSGFSDPKGAHFGPHSGGHTGWTGPCFWVDPDMKGFFVFMTNRNHPAEGKSVRPLRNRLSTLAAEAMGAEPKVADNAPPPVLQGIDTLDTDGFAALAGKTVGLITNQTGVDRSGRGTTEILAAAPGVKLARIFSPEHGLKGALDQENVPDAVDERTGLPVISLYKNKDRRPDKASLAGLDVLVFDIQDIGCRFYTYISTMLNCMEAASEAGIGFVVLDRVNPIDGVTVEGPMLTEPMSFVACHPLPVRHGMTAGELAKLFVAEKKLSLKLEVIPVRGWKRDQDWTATGLTWVNPSPNMRSPDEAVLYPGIGLLEFTNLSVGRGTATPFELVGAPWVDGAKLAAALQAAQLTGLKIEPAEFTPDASVFKGQKCAGVRLTVTERKAVASVRAGIAIALALRKEHKDVFQIEKMDKLLGDLPTRKAVQDLKSLPEIEALWNAGLEAFMSRRAAVLMYQ